MTEIHESGMIFRFPDTDCYRIESDPDVAKLSNVKVCECVAAIKAGNKDHIVFLEAKSSAPKEKVCRRELVVYNGATLPDTWDIITDFDRFVSEICQKFEDSFSTFHAISRGRHGKDAADRLPAGCNSIDSASPMFVLVISGFREEWLAPLNDAIKRRLRHFLNAWKIRDTAVKTLTPAGAGTAGLPIVCPTPLP
ncbi:MAG: hypothetical protein K2H83_05150 [Duncaniella sp.]|nr:hypothetical protein [Duncaniella sp.]